MFGNMGQMMQLLKDLPRLKAQAEQMQQRLAEARYQGEAGGGQARATVDGKGDLLTLQLDPELAAGGDRELIEELTVAAVRDAVARSRTGAQEELKELTGGMDLGGLMNMLGQQ